MATSHAPFVFLLTTLQTGSNSRLLRWIFENTLGERLLSHHHHHRPRPHNRCHSGERSVCGGHRILGRHQSRSRGIECPHRGGAITSQETTIRALRAASNHAIQAGDLAAVSATLADDFVVIVGNGALLTRVQYLAAFAADFSTPGTIRYERITDSIDLSTSDPLAAEHGHWIGRLPDGRPFFTGTYLAMWRHSQNSGPESGWKLRSELFVSLTCSD